jgi:hypothetical protein
LIIFVLIAEARSKIVGVKSRFSGVDMITAVKPIHPKAMLMIPTNDEERDVGNTRRPRELARRRGSS